jgi:hypothetical protein
MRIDQRNAGASVTALDAYAVDRWQYEGSQTSKSTLQQNAASVTPPVGFKNYYGATSSSAYSVTSTDFFFIGQRIEGFNVADLGWGTANAATVTLSFWVRSSLTGTFGGSLTNNSSTRSYPFSYTISSANTWEQKTITIAGDTSGTWVTNNGIGIRVRISLGAGSTYSGTAGSWAGADYRSATGATSVVGTNGATFYITGVQLEKGTTATSFDYRPYGTELALCQRYFYKASNPTGASTNYVGITGAISTTRCIGAVVVLPVPMRLSPLGGMSVTTSGTLLLYTVNLGSSFTVTSITPYAGDGATSTSIEINVASGLTAGTSYLLGVLPSASVSYSAEL